MIDQVKQGQKITADQQNKIIDACNGLLEPAEGDFTTTPKGTLFSRGAASTSSKQSIVPEMLFQAMKAKAFKMTSRGEGSGPEYASPVEEGRTWYVNLGNDKAKLLEAVNSISDLSVVKVVSIAGLTSFDIEIDDAQLSSTKNGWFDMASYGDAKKVKAMLYNSQSLSGGVLVLTDLSSDADVKNRAQTIANVDDFELSGMQIIGIDESLDGTFSKQYQIPFIGFKGTHGHYPDSSLSGLKKDDEDYSLSSIQDKTFTQTYIDDEGNEKEREVKVQSIYDFDSLDNSYDYTQQLNSMPYDVIVRKRTLDENKAVVEYINLSSLTLSGMYVPPDADLPEAETSSLQTREIENGTNVEELFDFHLSGTHYGLTKYDWQYGLSDEVEVVVRDNRTAGHSKVNYIPKSWLSAVGGDKNVLDVRRSIEYVNNPDPYYQLYSFGDPNTIDLDPIGHHGGFDFVVRYHNAVSQREEIQYGKLDLSSIAPISGDANVIPNTQNTIITVEDLQGNKWQQLYRVGTEDPSIQVNCSFHTYDSGDYNYLLNEGNLWPNPEKQFVVYNQQTKRLEYVDVGLHIPKVTASDLDDDVLPEISTVIIPEVSTIVSVEISAQLSALDDRYWIKGEDNTENYGSSIGDSNKTQVIDLDNKQLVCSNSSDYWSTGSIHAAYDLTAQSVKASYQLKIGNTTLNESQLQQLLALLNA